MKYFLLTMMFLLFAMMSAISIANDLNQDESEQAVEIVNPDINIDEGYVQSDCLCHTVDMPGFDVGEQLQVASQRKQLVEQHVTKFVNYNNYEREPLKWPMSISTKRLSADCIKFTR